MIAILKVVDTNFAIFVINKPQNLISVNNGIE